MQQYERLIAEDGYEVLLFPLDYLYMSQDEGGDYSHLYTYSIDLLGWGPTGRITHCPYYAPCSCKCVQASTGSRVFQSLDKVHLPDGRLTIVCFHCAHDNNPVASLNDTFTQGDLIGHTGTEGHATGDHLHLNTSVGEYAGFYDVGTGHYQLRNSTHVYNTMYVNDTVIKRGFNHNWQVYQGGITPDYRKYKFKWVLYANKLRNRNMSR